MSLKSPEFLVFLGGKNPLTIEDLVIIFHVSW